eukprot:CAMPEP_0171456288 /NCGR_PEP_ID=MMETSP0945-20130129/2832_1 /TAXON_ID=109269 /ORGANISM="Vaucheria litorea, Strain CCMP2940" /LENGTH=119 /DNA_ID=CAMNT_0011981677 /DNA_START=716 /DNA_END=1075 /DNA_ORIENTATION=+
MRCLSDAEKTICLILKLQDAGAAMINVHGSTLSASKTRNGAADWSIIKQIKNKLDIPIIANEGIEKQSDIKNALNSLELMGSCLARRCLKTDPALFDQNVTSISSVDGFELAQRQLSLA